MGSIRPLIKGWVFWIFEVLGFWYKSSLKYDSVYVYLAKDNT